MSANQAWRTPQWLFDHYNREYEFALDAAADDENHKCPIYLTEKDDGLKTSWVKVAKRGWVWVNPPWNDVESWVNKALEEWDTFVQPSFLLLPVRTCQKWFHTILSRTTQGVQYTNASIRIEFYEGRIQFDVPSGIKASSNPERNMNLIIGSNLPGIHSVHVKTIRHLSLNPI